MGGVVTKNTEVGAIDDMDVDLGEAQRQAQRVGRLSMVINAMRPRPSGPRDGAPASSAWARGLAERGTALGEEPAVPEPESEEEKARLAREEELRVMNWSDPEGKLKYDAELEESETEDRCAICDTYKRDAVFSCRVCGRPHHHGCLIGRGLGLDTNSSRAMEGATTDVGWSCPDCETLSELLSMDDMSDMMIKFDSYDTDGDSNISLSNYIESESSAYQQKHYESMPSSKVRECEEMFRTYDRDNDGVVTWWDYSMVETIKILQREAQNKLLEYLKPKEIAKLKKFFRISDQRSVGLVTVGESEQAYRAWLRALGLHETEETMQSFEKTSRPEESNKIITWERFLRNKALALLTARPNTVTIKPFVTSRDETAL